MELRYLGFDQLENARAYRFDVIAKGEPNRQVVVTADFPNTSRRYSGRPCGPGNQLQGRSRTDDGRPAGVCGSVCERGGPEAGGTVARYLPRPAPPPHEPS
jgi:hypothetical protein